MKYSVLIVDDFENTRWVIQRAIADQNYEVLQASNGAEALKFFDGRQIDLLITDLNMPEINGTELVDRVRKMPKYEFIPIIMLTTERNADKLKQAEAVRVTAIVNKPFELDKFRKIVTKCLNQVVR